VINPAWKTRPLKLEPGTLRLQLKILLSRRRGPRWKQQLRGTLQEVRASGETQHMDLRGYRQTDSLIVTFIAIETNAVQYEGQNCTGFQQRIVILIMIIIIGKTAIFEPEPSLQDSAKFVLNETIWFSLL
jgi:hypothetical protein